VAWTDGHDRQGTELCVGVNGRSIKGKTKAAVPAVTACFADRDLGGESIDCPLHDPRRPGSRCEQTPLALR
jgi:hypothetical protein